MPSVLPTYDIFIYERDMIWILSWRYRVPWRLAAPPAGGGPAAAAVGQGVGGPGERRGKV